MTIQVARPIDEFRCSEIIDSLTPHWLLGKVTDSQWLITDVRREIAKIDFDLALPWHERLTNPENGHLLATAKQYAIEVRSGSAACVTTAKTHRGLATALLYIIHWMRRHHIRAFSNLSLDAIQAFTEDAKFGVESIVDAAPTLINFVDRLLDSGGEIPTSICEANGFESIRVDELLDRAGLPRTLCGNERIAWVVAQTADRIGLPLKPRQRKFLEKGCPDRSVLKSEPIRKLIRPFEDLFRLRFRFTDRLCFPPYNPSASAVSTSLGKACGRTATLPRRQGLDLVEKSVRWVLHYSDDLLSYRASVHQIYKRVDKVPHAERWQVVQLQLDKMPVLGERGVTSPWPLRVVRNRKEGTQLNQSLRFLAIACWVVIGGFVGRRRLEIEWLETGCVLQDAFGLRLEAYIEKTLRAKDSTPCPDVVRSAVAVLEKLTASARAITGSPRLNQFVGAEPNKVFKLTFDELNAFAEYVNVPRLPDESRWIFAPHQLRRFFALQYFWQWVDGDLPSLACQLKHNSLSVTQRYVTDVISGAMFADMQTHFTKEILTEAAMGERKLFGGRGSRMQAAVKRLTAILRGKLKVVDRNQIEAMVERYLTKGHIIVQPNPWTFCACSPGQNSKGAHCRKNSVENGPDLKQASAATCAGCPFGLITEHQKDYLEHEMARDLACAEDSSLPSSIRQSASKRAREIGEALVRHRV